MRDAVDDAGEEKAGVRGRMGYVWVIEKGEVVDGPAMAFIEDERGVARMPAREIILPLGVFWILIALMIAVG